MSVLPGENFAVQNERAGQAPDRLGELRKFGDFVKRPREKLHLAGALVGLRANSVILLFHQERTWGFVKQLGRCFDGSRQHEVEGMKQSDGSGSERVAGRKPKRLPYIA